MSASLSEPALELVGEKLYLGAEADTNFASLAEQYLSIRRNCPAISALEIDWKNKFFAPPYTGRQDYFMRRAKEFASLVDKILETNPQLEQVHMSNNYLPLKVLYSILTKCKSLKRLRAIFSNFIADSKEEYDSMISSLQSIPKTNRISAVEDIALCSDDIGLLVDDEKNDEGFWIYYGAELPRMVLTACPNVPKINYILACDTKLGQHHYAEILGLCRHNLQELSIHHQYPFLKCLLNALFETMPPNLHKLVIELCPDKEDCERLASFLTPDRNPVQLKELHYKFDNLKKIGGSEEREESLLRIVQALARNETLNTFRFTRVVPGPLRDDEGIDLEWGLNDTISRALLGSVSENPRITELEASFESPHSDIVQSIQTYVTVHRQMEFIREQGNTPINRILLVNTLSLFRDNINYLFCALQTNPSICAPTHVDTTKRVACKRAHSAPAEPPSKKSCME